MEKIKINTPELLARKESIILHCKAAMAALDQHALYPADVHYAERLLQAALQQ